MELCKCNNCGKIYEEGMLSKIVEKTSPNGETERFLLQGAYDEQDGSDYDVFDGCGACLDDGCLQDIHDGDRIKILEDGIELHCKDDLMVCWDGDKILGTLPLCAKTICGLNEDSHPIQDSWDDGEGNSCNALGWGGYGVDDSTIDKHGMEMEGLLQVCIETSYLPLNGHKVEISYDQDTHDVYGRLMTQGSWTQWHDPDVLCIGNTERMLSMQEIADKVALYFDQL